MRLRELVIIKVGCIETSFTNARNGAVNSQKVDCCFCIDSIARTKLYKLAFARVCVAAWRALFRHKRAQVLCCNRNILYDEARFKNARLRCQNLLAITLICAEKIRRVNNYALC